MSIPTLDQFTKDTEALIADLQNIDSAKVQYPARPAYGDLKDEERKADLKDEERKATQWFRRLQVRTQQLGMYCALERSASLLKLFPSVSNMSQRLCGYDYHHSEFVRMLNAELDALRTIAKSSTANVAQPTLISPAEKPAPPPDKEGWFRDRWPDRRREGRCSLGDTQKEAAHKIGVKLPTYKKWEEGRRPPDQLNMPKVVKYIESAKG